MMVSAENDPRRAGTIWMRDLDEPAPVVTPLVEAVFRRIGPEDIPALAAELGGDAAAEISKRFAAGRQAYGAWVEARLAAYGWVSFEEEYIGELRLRLKLLPGEAYIWDCATLPHFRQKYLYSALLVYILAELRAGRFCRAWIGADQENMLSQRGMARAGFHHVADLVIARAFALRLAWVEGHPNVPDHLVVEARRVFLDNRDKVWLNALSSARPE